MQPGSLEDWISGDFDKGQDLQGSGWLGGTVRWDLIGGWPCSHTLDAQRGRRIYVGMT